MGAEEDHQLAALDALVMTFEAATGVPWSSSPTMMKVAIEIAESVREIERGDRVTAPR